MGTKKINITPTTNMLHSLKRTGYHWSQALMDIVDNSVDALRVRYDDSGREDGLVRIIPVGSDKNVTEYIIIADNGIGISAEQLQEILRLGESGKRGTSALGTFGMGLKTAAMSLGTRLTIVSTTSTVKKLRTVTWDVDACMQNGKFEAVYDENPSQHTVEKYKEVVGGDIPGTVILIANLHEGIPTSPAIIQTINAKCAHAYRHILNDKSPLGYEFPFQIIAGKTTAAKEVAKTNDPLCLEHEYTDILIGGKDGSFKTTTYGGYPLQIRMVHFVTPEKYYGMASRQARTGHGLGQYMFGTHRQGVYWLREGREICCGSFWPSQPFLSNVYAEISFEDSGIASENSPIRMDFGKKNVEMDDDLRDYLLRHVFEPHLEKLRKESKERAKLKKKSDRTAIMSKVAKVALPPDQFGRSKANPKDRKARALENIFSSPKSNNKPKRKNSKYRGTGMGIGDNETQLEFEECVWTGSSLPFAISYSVGDPVCKIQINVEDPWIERNVYLNDDPVLIARSLQLIAAMAVSLMYEDEEKRHEVYTKQGALLNIFDDDFGRMESDLQETELEAPSLNDAESENGFSQMAEAK
tara:strand:+ start:38 stop:1786 length:1749 start_codon:yes stop_codon:yes gene_type:complete